MKDSHLQKATFIVSGTGTQKFIEFPNCTFEQLSSRFFEALKSINADLSDLPEEDAVNFIVTDVGFFSVLDEADSIKLLPTDVSSELDSLIALLEVSDYFNKIELNTPSKAGDDTEWQEDDERPFDSTFWM